MPRISFNYRGFIVPVFTPLKPDNTLNLSVVPSYAEYLAQNGIKGVLVGGTTGEGPSLSVAERKLLAEAWSKAVKSTQQHLMIQVGGAPLPDVIELARHAQTIKANSILCLPELYFKASTSQNLKQYLKHVGEAAPNTPLLYYHIPRLTNVNVNMGEFLTSIGDEIPTFVGIKFTSNDLVEATQALKADKNKFVVFFGGDQLISAAYMQGIDSFIGTSMNMFPRLAQEILEVLKTGNMLRAKEAQEKLTERVDVISKYGDWVETMKHAMNMLTNVNVGVPRAPLQTLSAETLAAMKEDLKRINAL